MDVSLVVIGELDEDVLLDVDSEVEVRVLVVMVEFVETMLVEDILVEVDMLVIGDAVTVGFTVTVAVELKAPIQISLLSLC